MHCDDAWCLEVCPAAAISRDPETGAVQIDEARCAGCKMCLLACPLGNVHFDAADGVARKCDLCGGDPLACAAAPSAVLQYCEPGEVVDAPRESLDARLRRLLHAAKGGT